jgi:hypothetical protein
MCNYLQVNTILFSDDQMIVTSTEDDMHRAVYALNNVAIKYNFQISVNKTKTMVLKGKVNMRPKIVLNNHTIEEVNSFNYLGYTIAITSNKDLEIKLNRFHQMCGTIRRIVNNKKEKTYR